MQIIYKKPSEITPYENNPRKNDDAVKAVAASIREFGFNVPIVLDQKGEVVAGHTRLKAAKRLKLQEVPCVVVDNLTEAQIMAYRLADNKTSSLSAWDKDLLKLELEKLKGLDFDLELTAFSFDEIARLGIGIGDDTFDEDAVLESIKVPVTKFGDIWQLGTHRVMCGDSTVLDSMGRLVAENYVDLIVTDPPYNVNYGGKAEMLQCYDNNERNTSRIKNDNMGAVAFQQFLTDAFTNMHKNSKQGAPIYVFHAESTSTEFRVAFKDAGFSLRQCLIWEKNTPVMGRQDYQWKHEPILYGWKEGAAHPWYSDRQQTTLLKFNRSLRNDDHPTMKPIDLCAYLIGNSSKSGDIVLDSFGGSGSTLIACEQTERTCYMMELDEKYCDVIVMRWENFTGKKATLIRDSDLRDKDHVDIDVSVSK